MRGDAISLTLLPSLFPSSYSSFWRMRYLRFIVKKLREQGSISWSTLMRLVNISEVIF